jgi:hypothetical protein
MEEFLLRPYKRLWTWAASRPSAPAQTGGYLIFTLAILATIPILIIVGGLMAIGSIFAAIMG